MKRSSIRNWWTYSKLNILCTKFKWALSTSFTSLRSSGAGDGTFCSSFFYILNMESLISKHWTKAMIADPMPFQFYLPSSCPVFILLLSMHSRILQWKGRAQREMLSWEKAERWSEVTCSEGMWVLQLYWGTEQSTRKKKGSGEGRQHFIY